MPKNILPFKHYEKDIIEGVTEGWITSDTLGYEDYPCEMTMKRWREEIAIPCNSANSKIKISHKPPLKGLEGFEPKDEYGSEKVTTDAKGNKHYYRNGAEFKVMRNTQTEMGIISNLITDMTLKGATEDELARAVRHSMVVIDAEKHKLD